MSDRIGNDNRNGIRLSRRRFPAGAGGGAGVLMVGIRMADAADAPVPLGCSATTSTILAPMCASTATATC
jgi:hypothetical protein